MNKIDENIDILEYLQTHENKELLRFITCGSVDDGKSTLIGRLLHDTKLIYEDQLNAVKRDSEKVGTTGQGKVDLALLVDGLQAEREQGITIDVAYRYFSTDKRKFIIADTPGHEQYTRNMATGASTCNLAIMMIDARQGVLTQTRRHSFLVSLLGIKHVVVAINKMDLVGFSEERFNEIRDEYLKFADQVHLKDIKMIPVSALDGDNVVDRSERCAWYTGPTLLEHLEDVNIGDDRNFDDFRFPIQYVNRPNLDFRGYCGTVASGHIKKGDAIVAIPSKVRTKVKDIVTFEGSIDDATPPLAVTIVTEDEIDISRGEMLAKPDNVPQVDREIEAVIIWMTDQALLPNKPYMFKQTTNVVPGTVSEIHYAVDVNTLEKQAASQLELNHVARCRLSLSRAIPFDAYKRNKTTGSFIVIDRLTNVTVGAGVIVSGRENATDRAFWEEKVEGVVTREKAKRITSSDRELFYLQKARTVLISGLLGSGRSVIAAQLERRLHDAGRAVMLIDSEDWTGQDTPGTREDAERVGRAARLLNEAGLITIVDASLPTKSQRNMARKVVGPERFFEVNIVTSDESREKRLKEKGQKLSEEVLAVYEQAKGCDMTIDLDQTDIDSAIDQIVQLLEQ